MDCLTKDCDENSREDDEALLGMLPADSLTEGRDENSSKDDEALLCMSPPAVVFSWDGGLSSCIFESSDTEHSGFSSNTGSCSSSVVSSVAELAVRSGSTPAGKLSVSSEESDEATESGRMCYNQSILCKVKRCACLNQKGK